MVAVSDVEALAQQRRQRTHLVAPGLDHPEAVLVTFNARTFDVRGLAADHQVEELRELPSAVAGDHEDRTELRLRCLQQLEAVSFRAGHRELVRFHRPLFPRLRFHFGKQGTPRESLAALLELLLVDVEHRRLVPHQRPIRLPRLKQSRDLRVALVAFLGKLKPNCVARVSPFQRLLLAGRNHVVRRSEQFADRPGGGGVAQSAKGQKLGH